MLREFPLELGCSLSPIPHAQQHSIAIWQIRTHFHYYWPLAWNNEAPLKLNVLPVCAKHDA